MTGIYRLVNMVNGKTYIGLSANIERRWIEHRTPRNMRKQTSLARALRKYGCENFRMEVIEECDNSKLSEREMFWIATLKPEYNRTDGGIGPRGFTVSQSVRKKLSIAGRRQWDAMTTEQQERVKKFQLTGPGKGHPVSDEVRNKIRTALLGRKDTPEVRLRKSLALTGKHRPNILHKKPVICEGIEREAYGFFNSVKSAAESYGIDPTRISACLHGRQSGTLGLKWSYTTLHYINYSTSLKPARIGREMPSCEAVTVGGDDVVHSNQPSTP